MGGGLKYWEVARRVEEVGPRTPREHAVLYQLAMHANSEGAAFPGEERLMQRTRLSKSSLVRALRQLELSGWVAIDARVVPVETPRGWEKKGNRYRLNLFRLGYCEGPAPAPAAWETKPVGWAGKTAARDEGGCPARGRQGMEGRGEGADPAASAWPSDCGEGECPAALGFGVGGDDDGEEVVVDDTMIFPAEGPVERAVEGDSARCQATCGEVSDAARRGVKNAAPIRRKDFEGEVQGKRENPLSPPGALHSVEKQPQRQRLPDQGRGLDLAASGDVRTAVAAAERRGEATARATATTTGSRGNVVEFPADRGRARRESRRAVRARLDGEDAALWDETERVLRACGVDLELCGRKLWRAVENALEGYAEKPGESIASAGALAEERWNEYVALGTRLTSRVGMALFFWSGLWLQRTAWPYDREYLKQIRRGRW